MHLTQGTFSYLPPLTDDQIRAQVQYALDNDWPISIEFTDDPHPRNFLWSMWGLPMFDIKDAIAVMDEVRKCREARSNYYIRINAYDRTLGRQTTALSFIVNRPKVEPGFRIDRQMGPDRQLRYTLYPYSSESPVGERYGNEPVHEDGVGPKSENGAAAKN